MFGQDRSTLQFTFLNPLMSGRRGVQPRDRYGFKATATHPLADPSAAPARQHLSPDPPPNSPQGWRDEVWALVVGAVDGVLRSYYGVAPFTQDPRCLFRIGRTQLRDAVSLADGTRIEAGEAIGTLHFWNEHLPQFSGAGPNVGWAVTMQRRVAYSLRALAHFVERDEAWRDIRAFRGEAALSSRLGDVQLARVVQRFGFEDVAHAPSMLRQMHDVGECFSAWGLARAYNPVALAHQRFFRPYHDLWISRATLVALHKGPRRAASPAVRPAAE